VYKHVRLSQNEYDRLVSEYGETKTNEAIKFLDEYVQRKGYKSKDDNLTLRNWVFNAVDERKTKVHNFNERNYDYDALAKLAGIGGDT
jgi:hypothetical protein